MIARLQRLFSLSALKELKSLSEKNSQKSYEEFYKNHQEFIKNFSEHIYCMPKKITPAQKERAEMLSDEIIKLSPIHFRILIFLLQELKTKGFNYKPFTRYAKEANKEEQEQNRCSW